MSDQAESQRTRNCTRLLYIPISKNVMTTRTPKMIQAMFVLSSGSGNQSGRYHRDGAGAIAVERSVMSEMFVGNSAGSRRRIRRDMETYWSEPRKACVRMSLLTMALLLCVPNIRAQT